MQHLKTYKLKQILFGILWLLLAIAAIVLLVAAINKKEEKKFPLLFLYKYNFILQDFQIDQE